MWGQSQWSLKPGRVEWGFKEWDLMVGWCGSECDGVVFNSCWVWKPQAPVPREWEVIANMLQTIVLRGQQLLWCFLQKGVEKEHWYWPWCRCTPVISHPCLILYTQHNVSRSIISQKPFLHSSLVWCPCLDLKKEKTKIFGPTQIRTEIKRSRVSYTNPYTMGPSHIFNSILLHLTISIHSSLSFSLL